MKTQLSRDSFDGARRYSGVYLQQGRMITDADWNEETEIARRRLDDALADTVVSGVPREHGLTVIAGKPLRLRAGRLYAGGVGAVVTGTPADPAQTFGLDEQADFPLPDGVAPPSVSYRLYADVWERTVTCLEDDALRDPAFQGADTATRMQSTAQLKWCGAGIDPEDSSINPPIGDATLTLTLRRQAAELDACDPCAREIALPPRVGNYLFRLEVHAVEGRSANPNRMVLKWSSENGAEQHLVGTEPADFKGADWAYEYFTTRTEKHVGVHLNGGISPLAGQIVEGFPAAPPDGYPSVRRWDGYCVVRRQGTQWSLEDGRERGVDLATGTAAEADGHVSLANGRLHLQLSSVSLDLRLAAETAFVAGDYWLAPVRESVDEAGDVLLDEARPVGIRHHYLLLASIDAQGAEDLTDTDRQQRLHFPSLTTLAASDVDYAPQCPSGLFGPDEDTVQRALDRFCSISAEQISYHSSEDCPVLKSADTVKGALDLLCSYKSRSCRITIGGGDDHALQETVMALRRQGETAFPFCLPPGTHIVDQPIALTQAGGEQLHFSLQGCGPASRLVLQAGLDFTGLASVRIADVAIEIDVKASMTIGGGEEVAIERCRITAQNHGPDAPITVAASRLVRVADSDVQALRTSRLRVAAEFFRSLELGALEAVFREGLDDATLNTGIREALEWLGSLRDDQAARYQNSIELKLREWQGSNARLALKFELAEAKGVSAIAASLVEPARPPGTRSLEKALRALRDLLVSGPTLAMVVAPEGGHVVMSDSCVNGVLSVNGTPMEPALASLGDGQLSKLGSSLRRTQSWSPSNGVFLLARNQIAQIRVGGVRLQDDGSLDRQDLRPLFSSIRLTDNVFTMGVNDVLCADATLSGNRFAAGSPLATIIAEAAFYLGNHGPVGVSPGIRGLVLRSNTDTRSDLNSVSFLDIGQ